MMDKDENVYNKSLSPGSKLDFEENYSSNWSVKKSDAETIFQSGCICWEKQTPKQK